MSKKRTENTRRNSGAGKAARSGTKDKNDSKDIKNSGKRNTESTSLNKSAKGKNSTAGGKTKSGKSEREPAKNSKGISPGAEKIYKESKSKKRRNRHSSIAEGDRNYGDAFNNSEMLDVENVFEKERPESHLHYTKPLPKAKEPISPFKRMLKRLLFYTLTVLILVSVCFVLSITVFFKIDAIEVEGETRYPAEDIIGSCNIEIGDNLILCNTSTGESEIWKKYPYIESVDIRKKLFNKIVIEVREAVPASVIESDGKYVLLSESGKIIDISDKKQSDVPIIMGAKLMTPKLSSSVKYKDPKVEEYISEILSAAEEYKLGQLRVIDVGNLSKIIVETKTGLHIILGTPENVDYKLKTAKKIIDKDIPANDVGTLDVSLSSADGGKSYFSSKKKTSEPADAKPSVSEQSSKQSSAQTSTPPQSSGRESSSEVTSQPGPAAEVSADQPSDNTPIDTPDDTPDYTPDDTPDYTPDDTPDYTPDDTPDYTPDDTPDYTPDDTPDYTPDDTPDYTPDDTPDYTPDYTPDDTPDNTPEDNTE